MDTQFEREHHEVSRALEYFSETELTMQMGHAMNAWPLVLVKELVDNALDATESLRPPEVRVRVADSLIEVADNGPGIPAHVIGKSLDYFTRISDKALYVSPTRGQLGNALKCVWAAPFVAVGEGSAVIVESQGVRHEIRVHVDRLRQQPAIAHTKAEVAVTEGTVVQIEWQGLDEACFNDEFEQAKMYNDPIYDLLFRFSAFNPHARFLYRNYADEDLVFEAPATDWNRWTSDRPPSAWWYTPEQLCNLIANTLVCHPERTLREFLLSFDGMKRTAKQKAVAEGAGMSGWLLNDLLREGAVDKSLAEKLKWALQEATKPCLPNRLGTIGKDNLTSRLEACGCDNITYKKIENPVADVKNGEMPWVIEFAMGVQEKGSSELVTATGLNSSPTLKQPISHPILSSIYREALIEPEDPVVLLVHIGNPAFTFAERGKGALALGGGL